MDLRPPQKEIVDILMSDEITEEKVEVLQEKLGALTVDGIFGPKTASRVMEYLNVDPVLAINLSKAAIELLEKNGQGQAYEKLLEKGMPTLGGLTQGFDEALDNIIPESFRPTAENTPALASDFGNASSLPVEFTPTTPGMAA